eukprot:CAMPEP_0114539448 /NCGR_PEP_ID=MMETSP0114-20121206/242_1 /TAXON_ID=31324 /ORGANISM="Goniomonas sp, Strain m" /LENGTH=305 /DNA_ID=CAMNT_0001723549 /DNA_START=8 /DNA_END=925 /DNA_ORIENTATION=-
MAAGTHTHRWLVCIDGSDVSLKSWRMAKRFISHRPGEDNEVVVMHVHDPSTKVPAHLTPEHLQHDFEPKLHKLKSDYQAQSRDAPPLQGRFLSQPSVPGSGKTGARNEILKYAEDVLHPELIFIGSFGQGGQKLDCLGTLTDGLVKCSKGSVAVIKHTAPVPVWEEGTTYVAAIDGSPTSLEAAQMIAKIGRPLDKLICVQVCLAETEEQQNIFETLRSMLSNTRMYGGVQIKYNCVIVPSMEVAAVGDALCTYARTAEADYLVSGSVGLSGVKRLHTDPDSLGSVSAYLSFRSRCHNIIYKPQR